MESILSYIWTKGLLPKTGLQTATGKPLHITDPGGVHPDKPNIFKDARLECDGLQLCGDVMLHEDTSEREQDLFGCNNEGRTIILHVLLNDTCATRHDCVDTLRITCPKELVEEFYATGRGTQKLPCSKAITELPSIQLHSLYSGLLAERFKEKSNIIERIFRQCDQRWDDTLLKVSMRSFGFGIQSDIFDKWASLLNTQALGKHSDNLTQIEAIFFGQAGLLNDDSIPYYYRNEAIQDAYYNELKREYNFLRNKFGLESLDHKAWGCGNSTPHLRIARLATLYYLKRLTISSITTAYTLTDIYRLFSHSLGGYWQNHTCFGGTETCGNGCMRQKQVDVIIINSIVPMLFIYGRHRKDERLCERAEELLHQIDSEENSITKRWKEQGLEVKCAADSQALLQLHRNYCRTNNCINCHFAFHYIKSRLK